MKNFTAVGEHVYVKKQVTGARQHNGIGSANAEVFLGFFSPPQSSAFFTHPFRKSRIAT